MPKSRSRAKFSWKQEYGGVPAWGIAAAIGVLAVIVAAPAVVNATTPAAAPYVRPSDAFSDPTPEPERPSVVFIGDSYTAGTGASAPSRRWSSLVSTQLGWIEANAALGGTGYVVSSGPEGCGLDYCAPYAEVLATVEADPSMVVISGGRNDGPQEDYAGKVAATIATAQERWPDAQIIVTSPLWDDDPAPEWISASIESVRQAAEGVTFLDIGQPLAGDSSLVIEDGVHPSDAGYAAITEAVTAALTAQGVS